MKLLDNLLKSVTSEYQGKGEFKRHADNHDDDHDDDHCDHGNQVRSQQYSTDAAFRMPADPVSFPSGVVCSNCATQTVTGAKFCHACGTAIEMVPLCASCGSKWPANATFCPQCGYKR
jgi:ribosomal protein L40E